MPLVPATRQEDQDTQKVMAGLNDLVKKSIAAIKAGGAVAEVVAIGGVIMQDIFPNLSSIAALPADVKAEPFGVAQAALDGAIALAQSLLA